MKAIKSIDDMILLPRVKSITDVGGECSFCLPVIISPTPDLAELAKVVASSYGDVFTTDSEPQCIQEQASCDQIAAKNQVKILFNHIEGLGKESYKIDTKSDIEISYSEKNGAFYALMTVRQMLLNGTLCHCTIADEPMLEMRGYMLDVSRGKIPAVDTLKGVVDMIASFKYNHFELYFEGSPFVYPGYEQYANKDALTSNDMVELDRYCRERYMELVPCMNTLGHMSPWLAHEELRHLAECEEGLNVLGIPFPPTTLDCQNTESLQFVLSLVDGITSSFVTDYINVGLDEPFELGKGKNKDKAAQVGEDKLYLEYVLKLHEELRNRNKTMIMWGDVAARNGDIVKDFPDDIVLLDWGYQAEYPFDKRASYLASLGEKFVLCPGTSSWLSVGGNTDNMMTNIINATQAAAKHNALGVILTDWGDGGHLQHSFVSTPAILMAAALSWSVSCDEEYLHRAIDVLVYGDISGTVGKLIMDIGRYSAYEERALECRTLLTIPLQFPNARGERLRAIEEGLVKLTLKMIPTDLEEIYRNKMCKTKHFDVKAFDMYIANLKTRLQSVELQCECSDILVAEIANTIALISTLEHARITLLAGKGNCELARELRKIAKEHSRLWLMKNKREGLDIGLKNMELLANNLDNNS